MTLYHSHENILKAFNYNGAKIELVDWQETIWCGKIGYAVNNTEEPNVDEILAAYKSLDCDKISGKYKPVRDCCISVNYLSAERLNGVFFGEMVETDNQADCFDILKIPSAQFMRIQICFETAEALGKEMWYGGIPPYQWIYDLIAPHFGYKPSDDTIPIVEYYGHYKPNLPEIFENKLFYLYVPVAKK